MSSFCLSRSWLLVLRLQLGWPCQHRGDGKISHCLPAVLWQPQPSLKTADSREDVSTVSCLSRPAHTLYSSILILLHAPSLEIPLVSLPRRHLLILNNSEIGWVGVLCGSAGVADCVDSFHSSRQFGLVRGSCLLSPAGQRRAHERVVTHVNQLGFISCLDTPTWVLMKYSFIWTRLCCFLLNTLLNLSNWCAP